MADAPSKQSSVPSTTVKVYSYRKKGSLSLYLCELPSNSGWLHVTVVDDRAKEVPFDVSRMELTLPEGSAWTAQEIDFVFDLKKLSYFAKKNK